MIQHILVQELINLLLTGRAVSNVFDGDIQLDTGATQKVRQTRPVQFV